MPPLEESVNGESPLMGAWAELYWRYNDIQLLNGIGTTNYMLCKWTWRGICPYLADTN